MTTSDFDAKDFRRALGGFATGVTIVATCDDGGRNWGFTANSFTSVSLEPPLVLACIAKSAFSCSVFTTAKSFSVNILSESQKQLANTFAQRVEDRFEGVSFRTEISGCPIFDNVVSWFDCQMHETVDAGDHVILIGRVLGYDYADVRPLGYCRGAYVSFGIADDILKSKAMSGQRQIGAIIECDRKILLNLDDDSRHAILPTAHTIGNSGVSDSLLGQLNELGVDTKLSFVYAVYDDNGIQNIYYRDEIETPSRPHPQLPYRWVSFDQIGGAHIEDRAVEVMLTRYISERQNDSFGVYVGDSQSGEVHVPA